MSQKCQESADSVFDGPSRKDDTKRVLKRSIAEAYGFHDGSDTGGKQWEKVKDLTRNDLWALSGFGSTTAFDGWTIEEMTRLGNALGAHIGKPYTKAMYICCTCC